MAAVVEAPSHPRGQGGSKSEWAAKGGRHPAAAAPVPRPGPPLRPHFGLAGRKAKDLQRQRKPGNGGGPEWGAGAGAATGLYPGSAEVGERGGLGRARSAGADGPPRQARFGCVSASPAPPARVGGATAPPSGRWRGTAVRALEWPQREGAAEWNGAPEEGLEASECEGGLHRSRWALKPDPPFTSPTIPSGTQH